MTVQNTEDHFWPKVSRGKSHECWNWKGSLNKDGYGYFRFEGRKKRVHRLAYEFFHLRKIPEGMLIMHLCDNPACCNPYHLCIGTDYDNARDRVDKGRSNGHKIAFKKAQFSAQDILKIRKYQYRLDGQKVANIFETTRQTIHRIWKAKRYPCKEGYYA